MNDNDKTEIIDEATEVIDDTTSLITTPVDIESTPETVEIELPDNDIVPPAAPEQPRVAKPKTAARQWLTWSMICILVGGTVGALTIWMLDRQKTDTPVVATVNDPLNDIYTDIAGVNSTTPEPMTPVAGLPDSQALGAVIASQHQ